MFLRGFAFTIGFIYLALGLLGFYFSFAMNSGTNASAITANKDAYYLLGIFATNFLLNCLYLGIGVSGLLATYRFLNRRVFARSVALLLGVLTVLGIVPALNAFGLFPLFGYNLWLHALTAIVAAYVGFWGAAEVTQVRRMDIGTDRVKVFEDR